ncbi:MAG: DUF3108 domain-containing protein [Gammaproteobacteria bacterium]
MIDLRRVMVLLLAITAAAALGAQAPGIEATAPQPGPAGAAPAAAAAAGAAIGTFSAHYQADWKTISVGTSDLELKEGPEPGRYVYTWTITAHGIFRLVYRDDLVQKSWFGIHADHVRPMKYRAVDGSSSVDLDFDWDGGRVRGTSETKQVDLKLKEGTQDVMSIQVEVMLDLKSGNLPKTFQIIDKDQVKEFIYTQEGTAKIRTALGPLDTVIVSSQRAGGNRILRMWFAPSLGFVPVQAERSRDGKLEFAMRIKSLKR